MSVRKAAELTGYSTGSVRRWIRQGKIPGYRFGEVRLFTTVDAITALNGELIAAQTPAGTNPAELAGELLPFKELAELCGYSIVRLQDIRREGKIAAIRGKQQKGIAGNRPWLTTVEEIERYRRELRTHPVSERKGAGLQWDE